jgi:hypothetical protein
MFAWARLTRSNALRVDIDMLVSHVSTTCDKADIDKGTALGQRYDTLHLKRQTQN